MSIRGSRGNYTVEYRTWTHMRGRCYTPTDRKYLDYGGRGITICEEWNTFERFLLDMGNKPVGLTLGRKDNNGSYCKANCEWQTAKQQANNRRVKSIQWTNVIGMTGISYDTNRACFIANAYTGGRQYVTLYRGRDLFEACCARKSWEAKQAREELVL